MIGGEPVAGRFLMEHLSSGWSKRPPANWAGRESPSERSKSIRIRGEEVFPTHWLFATRSEVVEAPPHPERKVQEGQSLHRMGLRRLKPKAPQGPETTEAFPRKRPFGNPRP